MEARGALSKDCLQQTPRSEKSGDTCRLLHAKTHRYSAGDVKDNISQRLCYDAATSDIRRWKAATRDETEVVKTWLDYSWLPRRLPAVVWDTRKGQWLGEGNSVLHIYSSCGARCFKWGEARGKPSLPPSAIRKANCTSQKGDCNQTWLNCTTEHQIVCPPLREDTLTCWLLKTMKLV